MPRPAVHLPPRAVAMPRRSTSSAANVADEKNSDRDSDKRQRAAIAAYAKRASVQIVDEYYDEAVSGADHIDTRPGFKAMLERLLSNGVRTIVVETANRFARDLMVQEVGFAMLKERGITLIAADSPDAFLDDTPTSRLIRQVLGSVSEFEKAMLVSKLRGARERKRANGHKVGRKSHAEARPEVVALAKTLRQRLHRGYAMSFRDISAELFALGHTSKSGKALHGLVGQEDAGLTGSAAQLSVKAALVRLGLVPS